MNNQDQSEFSRQIGEKENRMMKARKDPRKIIWFGFSMFGLIGWSVMVPTVLGTLLGLWIDKHYPDQYSWTLTFLLLGLVIGILNAWYWVEKERKEMQKESDKSNKNSFTA